MSWKIRREGELVTVVAAHGKKKRKKKVKELRIKVAFTNCAWTAISGKSISQLLAFVSFEGESQTTVTLNKSTR